MPAASQLSIPCIYAELDLQQARRCRQSNQRQYCGARLLVQPGLDLLGQSEDLSVADSRSVDLTLVRSRGGRHIIQRSWQVRVVVVKQERTGLINGYNERDPLIFGDPRKTPIWTLWCRLELLLANKPVEIGVILDLDLVVSFGTFASEQARGDWACLYNVTQTCSKPQFRGQIKFSVIALHDIS
ncbi:hypothetical protein RRG08_017448 [Elysia crispata]|uniref:Uncharacterized protein n=1 Tax=Elysia crispata TaxID=231223 RepID=A0AAE1B984_9GAST|nr:hypothetical protein RRG08_017448 [Elysia crispata]